MRALDKVRHLKPPATAEYPRLGGNYFPIMILPSVREAERHVGCSARAVLDLHGGIQQMKELGERGPSWEG